MMTLMFLVCINHLMKHVSKYTCICMYCLISFSCCEVLIVLTNMCSNSLVTEPMKKLQKVTTKLKR